MGGAIQTRGWSLDGQVGASMVVWVEPRPVDDQASKEHMGEVRMGRWAWPSWPHWRRRKGVLDG